MSDSTSATPEASAIAPAWGANALAPDGLTMVSIELNPDVYGRHDPELQGPPGPVAPLIAALAASLLYASAKGLWAVPIPEPELQAVRELIATSWPKVMSTNWGVVEELGFVLIQTHHFRFVVCASDGSPGAAQPGKRLMNGPWVFGLFAALAQDHSRAHWGDHTDIHDKTMVIDGVVRIERGPIVAEA